MSTFKRPANYPPSPIQPQFRPLLSDKVKFALKCISKHSVFSFWSNLRSVHVKSSYDNCLQTWVIFKYTPASEKSYRLNTRVWRFGFETSRFRNFSSLLFDGKNIFRWWEDHIPPMGRSYSADGKNIFRRWEERILPMGRTYSADEKNIFCWWEEEQNPQIGWPKSTTGKSTGEDQKDQSIIV